MLYGKNLEKTHLDIIGSSISMAAKIASIAKPNQILVGEFIYNILVSSADANFPKNCMFKEVDLDPIKWKYLSHFDSDSLYRVYEFSENYNI
jgi:adenylate cyclase